MSVTFQNRQLGDNEKIKDTFNNINLNGDEILADLTTQSNQLIQIIEETELDPNKDPEVTNARTSSVFGAKSTVKERCDAGDEFSLVPKMLGGGYLINPDGDVFKRLTSGVEGVNAAATVLNDYADDRWYNSAVQDGVVTHNITVTQTIDSPVGSNVAIKLTTTNNSDNRIIRKQRITQETSKKLDEVTLSFKTKRIGAVQAASVLKAVIGHASAKNNFATVVTDQVITLDSNFENSSNSAFTEYTATFTVSNNAKSFGLEISIELDRGIGNPLLAAFGDVFLIGQSRLERGAVPTDFIGRPYEDELLACMPYYRDLDQVFNLLSTAAGANSNTRLLGVNMRSIPTITQVTAGAGASWGPQDTRSIKQIGVHSADANTTTLRLDSEL